MPVESRKALIQAIRKIPIFKGLSPTQVRSLLNLCLPKTFKPGEIVCPGNTPSEEMFILLSGELAVVTADGLRVANIEPVTTVGEMGLITRQPRSATVETSQLSHVLIIRRTIFEQMLREDPELQIKVYRNIIEILSTKIIKDNIRTRDHLIEKVRYETKLKRQKSRTEAALELLVQQGGITRVKAEQYIAEKVQDVSLRILIVDDEAEIRRYVREVLSSFAVAEASNGEEALQRIQEERPDLVITDIDMPRMDGLALLIQMRSLYPDIPVVALIDYGKDEKIQEHGFDGIIEKPVKLEEFWKLMETALAREDRPSNNS